MEIRRTLPKPYEKSIKPAMSFEVDISHQKYREAIVAVDGWLESDDGRILTNVYEVVQQGKSSEVGAVASKFDDQFKEVLHQTMLVAPLDRKALVYMEKRRMENVKRDLFLALSLNVRAVVSLAHISHLHMTEGTTVHSASGRTLDGRILAYAHDPRFTSEYTNLWIISGTSGPFFLSLQQQHLRKEGIRINAVDWIQDFAPKLELGEYFIVEIPKGKVIEKAWNYAKKAEECYRQWDTKGAYANCRDAGKLLNSKVKSTFRNNPAIKKWRRAIEKFEKLTSMDLHEEDIKQEEPKGEISIGRPETEHILIVTKALIKYTEELLQERIDQPIA